MFFHWAGKVPADQVFEHPISTLDFYPTLLALANVGIPEGKKLDGKNIWSDLLKGHNPHKGEMLYAMSHHSEYTDTSARLDDWKVTRVHNKWQLYNLAEDIGETNDLAQQNPERLQQMVCQLEQWADQHSMPGWVYLEEDREQWKHKAKPYFEGTFDLK